MIGPKCVKCRKQLHLHHPVQKWCPKGKRNRALGGFSEFITTQLFEAKAPSKGGASEKRKDREVRRATKAQPCAACGTKGTDWNPVDTAHVRTWSVSQSDSPLNQIPLCRSCHRTQHHDGWDTFLIANPSVFDLLEKMGWHISEHPFQKGKLIMVHPEIA